MAGQAALLIVADDFGLRPSYDGGIAEAARAGAIDAASAMVLRAPDPSLLAGFGVAIGLHLEPESGVEEQLERFHALFGRDPTHIDGHHHCHASGPLAAETVAAATRLRVQVRSVSAEHREALRAAGVRTPDRLIGRYAESEPVRPAEVESALTGAGLPPGLTEWMTHPGRSDPASGSSYERGREEDLELLLDLAREPLLREARRRGRGAISASSAIDSSRS